MRLNLNFELARYLREHPVEPLPQTPGFPYSPRRWRIRDRMSEGDVVRLILAFKVGAPKQVLAEHYGIGIQSVKQLLRAYGVKKRSRYDMLP